jgi:hypothetical protein
MTISFNQLGNLGHLGNQMFQYSAAKGIANKNNTNCIVASSKTFGSNYDVKSKLDDYFVLECERGITNFPQYNESKFEFDSNVFNLNFDVDLFGYFQSWKYFNDIETQLRKDFNFKSEIYDPSREQFDLMFGGTKVISMHIRRGDYVGNKTHPLQSLEYYEKALSKFDNIPVIVFSDDLEWCNQQKMFENEKFFISNSEDCGIDLCLMSFCNYHIIANSSFSWWGSWLAKSEKTIAPKNWFGGSCINYSTEDLYCSDWIIL